MATVVKRKNRWQAQSYKLGVRHSASFESKSDAENWGQSMDDALASNDLDQVYRLKEMVNTNKGDAKSIILNGNTPEENGLPSVSEILSNKIDAASKFCGVYFLIDGNEIVYVGQSENIFHRLIGHSNKKFDGFAYLQCDKKDLISTESIYITTLKPKYNEDIPTLQGSLESTTFADLSSINA